MVDYDECPGCKGRMPKGNKYCRAACAKKHYGLGAEASLGRVLLVAGIEGTTIKGE